MLHGRVRRLGRIRRPDRAGSHGRGLRSRRPLHDGVRRSTAARNLHPHEFTLTDQDGRRVSLRALRGRVVILAFLYTASKTTAPLIAQQIRGALDELERHTAGVSALAVSVDPAADTPGAHAGLPARDLADGAP